MPSAHLVSAVMADYLAPALRAEGWKRTGTSFRWTDDSGDQAVIALRRSQGARPDWDKLSVNAALWTAAYIDLKRAVGSIRGNPSGERGVFTARVGDPDTEFPWWELTPDTAESCGRRLVEVVAGHVAPILRASLDRKYLLALRRSDSGPPGLRWLALDGLLVLLALTIDDGPSDELEQLIARARSHNDGEVIESWARTRLATRDGSHAQ